MHRLYGQSLVILRIENYAKKRIIITVNRRKTKTKEVNKMNALVTYKTGDSVMTMKIENVTKIEKVYNRNSYGEGYEETRIYTDDSGYHWKTFLSKGIINIFLTA